MRITPSSTFTAQPKFAGEEHLRSLTPVSEKIRDLMHRKKISAEVLHRYFSPQRDVFALERDYLADLNFNPRSPEFYEIRGHNIVGKMNAAQIQDRFYPRMPLPHIQAILKTAEDDRRWRMREDLDRLHEMYPDGWAQSHSDEQGHHVLPEADFQSGYGLPAQLSQLPNLPNPFKNQSSIAPPTSKRYLPPEVWNELIAQYKADEGRRNPATGRLINRANEKYSCITASGERIERTGKQILEKNRKARRKKERQASIHSHGTHPFFACQLSSGSGIHKLGENGVAERNGGFG